MKRAGSVWVPEGRGEKRPQPMGKQEDLKPYPKEPREKIVEMAQAGGRRPSEIAEEFGISSDSVAR